MSAIASGKFLIIALRRMVVLALVILSVQGRSVWGYVPGTGGGGRFTTSIHPLRRNWHVSSPFWTCHGRSNVERRVRKLFFVHIYKTAGTTFRQFFRNYAYVCGRRLVTMRCSRVSSESLQSKTSPWTSMAAHTNESWGYAGDDCELLDFVDGTTNHRPERANITEPEAIEKYIKEAGVRMFERISYDELLHAEIDVISGHLPIGLHENWLVDEGGSRVVDPLYVTFFRDPIHMYISGLLQINKQMSFDHPEKEHPWTFEEAVHKIKRSINDSKIGLQVISAYLLTPAQKVALWESNKTLGGKDASNVIKSNLVEYPVLVGIIECMSDSLELIRYALNSDNDPIVKKILGSIDISASKDNVKGNAKTIKNQASLSTSRLVRELKADPPTLSKLLYLLRYESEIYDFAREVHDQQVRDVAKVKG